MVCGPRHDPGKSKNVGETPSTQISFPRGGDGGKCCQEGGGACANLASSTYNEMSVTVTGNSGTTSPASASLTVSTATLSCGASKTHDYDCPSEVSTLSTQDFAAGETVTVTETLGDATGATRMGSAMRRSRPRRESSSTRALPP